MKVCFSLYALIFCCVLSAPLLCYAAEDTDAASGSGMAEDDARILRQGKLAFEDKTRKSWAGLRRGETVTVSDLASDYRSVEIKIDGGSIRFHVKPVGATLRDIKRIDIITPALDRVCSYKASGEISIGNGMILIEGTSKGLGDFSFSVQ